MYIKPPTDRVGVNTEKPRRLTGGADTMVVVYFEDTSSKEQKVCHSYPHILSRSKEQKMGKEKTAIPLKIQLQISFSGIPLKTLTGQRKQQHPDF